MSDGSRAVGGRIVAGQIPRGATPDDAVAAADRIFAALGARLGRWIGGDAYDTLIERALAKVRADHPVLRRVRWVPGAEGGLRGLDAADEDATGAAVRDATAATLDALAALLGRFVGDDLAARLMLQDWQAPRSDAEPENEP